jgi:hypothetical protein
MQFEIIPETQRILDTLTRAHPGMSSSTAEITADEFTASYKSVKESTSSSPSGRHIGHYKAAIGDPTLIELHTTMMSKPFKMGFAPDRWQRVTDIMLEKSPGDSRCHRCEYTANTLCA